MNGHRIEGVCLKSWKRKRGRVYERERTKRRGPSEEDQASRAYMRLKPGEAGLISHCYGTICLPALYLYIYLPCLYIP